jgi:hypothetical protein
MSTILSLALAIYFYSASRRERMLSFVVSPTPGVIVDAGEASKLSIFYEGRPIRSSVSTRQVLLWNAGREAIRPANVLEGVNIVTIPRVPILEARLLRVSRPVTEIVIDNSTANAGTIGVGWRILEPRDGAAVQLTIAAGPQVKVGMSGTIEGQRAIEAVSYSRLGVRPSDIAQWTSLPIVAILTGVGAFVFIRRHAIRLASPELRRFVGIYAFIVLIVLLCYAVVVLIYGFWPRLHGEAPPFPF